MRILQSSTDLMTQEFSTKREFTIPCYTPQILSLTQDVVIYDVQKNIMPLTIFYDFFGCTVPTISSCSLKDDLNIDKSGGVTLDMNG